MNYLKKVIVEQPLALYGSAKYQLNFPIMYELTTLHNVKSSSLTT